MKNKQSLEAFKTQRVKEEVAQRNLLNSRQALIDAPRVSVSIDAIYRERIGAFLPLSVNGEDITVPVDGSIVSIPEPFAVALKGTLMQFNKEALRGKVNWGSSQGDFYPTGAIPGLTK